MEQAFDQEPKTLADAIKHFADPEVSLLTMVKLRWKDGVCCPTCGHKNPRWMPVQRRWECKLKHAKRQFSAKTGTIFEDSPLGLDKWFTAIWLISNCRNGISSMELHRSIGVTQKTAWFMLHRIRLAMQSGTIEKSDGEAEADETFIGGKAKNMHKSVKEKKIFGRGAAGSGKQVVMGVLSRGAGTNKSRIVSARRVKDTTGEVLKAEIKKAVETGTKIYTDAHGGYRGLAETYVHAVVDHAVEYVRGRVHTNGMENFWSLLKRSIKGTYISVLPPHLDRYVDEQVFRFNERSESDSNRFRKVVSMLAGKRLTYDELTGHEATA
ncbi:MAG: IS1595 family transposase [Rhodospirillales bacterium]|nr:IS1595 family transposase [Rhodospirillales bacterium]